MTPRTYYKPPPASIPVLVRTDRPGRPYRLHWAAQLDGVLMTPEACNLLNAAELTVVDAPPELEAVGPKHLCRRCFRGLA